jgi:hypothetical protein
MAVSVRELQKAAHPERMVRGLVSFKPMRKLKEVHAIFFTI